MLLSNISVCGCVYIISNNNIKKKELKKEEIPCF